MNRSTNRNIGNAAKGEIQIVSERIVYENRYGTLYDDSVAFPGGVNGTYMRFSWHAPYSVAVLPVLTDGRIVLIEVFRHAQRRWLYEIPKGFGQTEAEPANVARIELLEEAGIKSGSIEHLVTVSSDPGFIANPLHIFVARDCEFSAPPAREEFETIRGVLALGIDEAMESLNKDPACDVMTRLAIMEYVARDA